MEAMGFLSIMLLWVGIGALIGKSKGRAVLGGFLGFFFGPIGWVITALLPKALPKCPDCGGDIVVGANKCRFCGFSFRREEA